MPKVWAFWRNVDVRLACFVCFFRMSKMKMHSSSYLVSGPEENSGQQAGKTGSNQKCGGFVNGSLVNVFPFALDPQVHEQPRRDTTAWYRTIQAPMGGLKLFGRLRARLKRRPQSPLDVGETEHGFAIERVR